jgi:ketosteroid isomerase-like protein
MSLEQTVQRLQDRVDICELLYAYCRHADRLDIDNMTSAFTDDCVVAYVPKEMAPAFHGKAALKKFLSEYFPNTISSSHHIDNVELLFDSNDQVTGHTYMYSFQRFKTFPAAADCHRWGRYELRLLRTAAGWRLSRMQLVSAAEYGGARVGEQFGRPWPPRFE